eukprot:1301702-Alexandrium_andersonii.AAC.1
MLWLIEHAGELLTKHLVGRDGRAALERLYGKPSRDDGWEFGGQVSFPCSAERHGPKLQRPAELRSAAGA